ncbi:AAA family ATPase [Tistrella bauzanensis]|uniref:AAA family ATPase n=1 Tax=Tistrella bauzanensis TaxID=657419 RepID=UPI0035561F2F
MRTAHLIHGYLGAGKTTFAKALEKEAIAIRFTQDEWMKKLYGDDPPAEQFAGCTNRVSELMEEMWTRCLQVGVDVVLDFGFWSRAERDRVRSVICSLGADCRLYRLSCSDDEAWKRIEARNLKRDSSLYIARNTFEVLKARFEPLSDDESRIEV